MIQEVREGIRKVGGPDLDGSAGGLLELLDSPKASKVEMNPMIPLHREMVDLRSLAPNANLVSLIAKLLVRNSNPDIPGYAVIPATAPLLKTRERAVQFQLNLIGALKQHLELHQPHAVRPQLYLSHSHADVYYQSDTLGIEAFQFAAFDGMATQTFHMDNLRQSYVSLCYGPNMNIKGGVPRLFDALSMAHDLGLAAVTDIIRLRRMEAEYTEIHTAFDLEGGLAPGFQDKGDRYINVFDTLESANLPLLLFSNRLEDGLLHGATTPLREYPEQPANRPISYAAIKHMPFVKKFPFASTHIVTV